MNIPPFAHFGILAPLQKLLRQLSRLPAAAKPASAPVASGAVTRSSSPTLDANHATRTTAPSHSSQSGRPLRVVRVIEANQPRFNVGRMVISGRMADVCAELDRLVEREAMAA